MASAAEDRKGSGTYGGREVIALFDLDGTLTEPRQAAEQATLDLLQRLRQTVAVGIVSGSDAPKLREQLGSASFSSFDFVFCENGCVVYEGGNLVAQQSLASHIGEEKLKEIINFALHYIADLDLPVKRGTFVEYRHGLLNLSPIGRSCSQAEREAFFEMDKRENIREKFKAILEKKFASSGLKFSIGGQISIDCFPEGWDKRLALPYLEGRFAKIHFFGDKTYPGGNDHEIFEDPRTVGHAVANPEETKQLIKSLFACD
ncbi:phosphomannomutase [Toxoplasma gondii ME49]|uniref:Phosphomannomutase n=18 Tax=Toxoplasma gondii TaxID=5811 RepID=B9PNG1_TOXGV|nr:phosphomannomutase [Toxoplasma gondii ME49]EPR60450.1 phosphomannomutase [Toxoplasma gondii GT1]ESS31354.1 phosphomannomutase [Toxoplasma gondii VEG]KAF4643462.1 phosphomannomutase [Toxoplasma gondii]KFG39046.1 phosphomannomutase [Toxoplasma gondii p89]KFG48393.1 phosphomannomutase [Toxoplasma gondii FOU]KFH04258.1 phosphomannomutase [Toxoplasma gondii VAND]KFH14775.1 phosphomannomutase [Toxoplasma gondii MAS]PIL95833.1 phosphomannomutase [Toxoplasma gondii COUG]PUA87095.1 phosphomannom|eukprot:XP_002366610.1 phosphomannomutase [Toxoplasma gondii ME49]